MSHSRNAAYLFRLDDITIPCESYFRISVDENGAPDRSVRNSDIFIMQSPDVIEALDKLQLLVSSMRRDAGTPLTVDIACQERHQRDMQERNQRAIEEIQEAMEQALLTNRFRRHSPPRILPPPPPQPLPAPEAEKIATSAKPAAAPERDFHMTLSSLDEIFAQRSEETRVKKLLRDVAVLRAWQKEAHQPARPREHDAREHPRAVQESQYHGRRRKRGRGAGHIARH